MLIKEGRGRAIKNKDDSPSMCPKCGSSRLYIVQTYVGSPRDKSVYGAYCRNCGTEFDDKWNILEPLE